MKSWLILLIGLAIAAGAAYVLLGGRGAPVAPPLDDIDEASRARLERVLRESERPSE